MKIGIIGLGYVGLPLVIQFAKSGAQVLGIDVDEAKVNALNAGESYIKHIPAAEVQAQRDAGQIEATVSYHDPHIPIIRPSREHSQFTGRESQDQSAEYDLFLLATHHDTYAAADLRQHRVPVVDTRHIQSEESAEWKFA